jgi:hypothetical protein
MQKEFLEKLHFQSFPGTSKWRADLAGFALGTF